MPTQFCFESHEDLQVFRALGGGHTENATSIAEEMSQSIPFGITSEQRLELARSFKKTSLVAEEWLPTVELLRHSLILNQEQVVFCFSQLPATKKNRALRDCFLFYLNSPLAQDRAAFLWSWLEQIKAQSHPVSQPHTTHFVSASHSAYLFEELCQASGTRFPFQTLGTPWNSGAPEAHHGSNTSAADALVSAIVQATSDSGQSAFVSFFGSAHSLSYLKCRLASSGLTSRPLFSSSNKPDSFWTKWLQSIRQAPDLDLTMRWDLNARLLEVPPYWNENPTDYLDRLSRQAGFSPTQRTFLEQRDVDSFSELSPLEKPAVLILPWMSLPNISGQLQFAFCDETLLESPTSKVLLSENELEQLFHAGFQLPRWSSLLQSRLGVLQERASVLNGRLFTSLPETQLVGFEITRIIPKLRTPSQNTENFSAPLEVKRLSATQLETYAECPSKYLFRRLKIAEKRAPMDDFALVLGQSVHLTLEELLSPTRSTALTENELKQTFESVISKNEKAGSSFLPMRFFLAAAFEKIIPKIIRTEQFLRDYFKPQRTLAVEKDFAIEIGGIQCVGKIDRIDLLDLDHLLVIDYKTGTVDFTPDHVAQGVNFQALLYWLGAEQVYGKPPAAILFYDLKKGELRRGLVLEEAVSKETKKELTRGHTVNAAKLNTLLEAGKEALYQHASSIASGVFAPTPSAEACRFCEATAFCRNGVGYV